MALNVGTNRTKKQFPALAAALVMSLAVGLVMVSLAVNALANSNSVPLQSASVSNSGGSGDQATIQQMQNEISQYQAREQQYQGELTQAATQLNQAKAQVQQYQSLINALQDAGVIQITQDGRVFISGGLGGTLSAGSGG